MKKIISRCLDRMRDRGDFSRPEMFFSALGFLTIPFIIGATGYEEGAAAAEW